MRAQISHDRLGLHRASSARPGAHLGRGRARAVCAAAAPPRSASRPSLASAQMPTAALRGGPQAAGSSIDPRCISGPGDCHDGAPVMVSAKRLPTMIDDVRMAEHRAPAERIERERMAIRNRAAAVLAHHHRRAELLGEVPGARPSPPRPECRRRRKSTGNSPLVDERRRLLDRGGIGRKPGLLAGRRIDQFDLAAAPPARRARFRCRPAAAPAGAQLLRRLRAPGRVFSGRREPPSATWWPQPRIAVLVAHLVQQAVALADRCGVDVADDRERPRIAGVSGGESGHRVQQPWPGTTMNVPMRPVVRA